MNLAQSFKMAFKAIASNKVRSLLTMLGIIIGVLSVSVLISVVQGATGEITGQLQGLGSNMLTVNFSNKGNVNLTSRDLDDLAAQTPGIAELSPVVEGKGAVKSSSKSMDDATIDGVNQNYFDIRNIKLASGRNIIGADEQYRTAVAVVGAGVADELFGHRDVLGSTINVNGRDFEIVGVLESEGDSLMDSTDKIVYIPFSTGQRLLSDMYIDSFFVSTTSADTVDPVKDTLDEFMMQRVRDEDSYFIFSQADVLDMMASITTTLTLMLGGIAAISLLVGGIGIMNIMLVSVTERTREIGIRKAIGAKRRSILTQFMIEALVISLVGGAIGLLLSWGVLLIIGNLMKLSLSISFGVASLALGFSAGVGLVFGMYPAAKASKLAPIMALRYE